MTLEAIAILHVPPDRARTALAALEPAPRVVSLEDAALVHLGMPLAEEPAVLAARLVEMCGALLGEHHEPRGVPVFPHTYALAARTWDAALEELGEAADWVPLSRGAPTLDLGALGLGGMGGAMSPEALRGMMGGADPAAMMRGVDPAALRQLLGDQDPGAAMQAAMGAMAKLAETGALDELVRSMSAHLPALQGGDVSGLAAHAERMLAANPGLQETLRRAMGEAEDEEDEEDEGE